MALKKLSLDELLDLEVTSVSKRVEQLQSAAAAITVVSRLDIHRSGANSLPEAMRLVPGLHVGRANASDWAVGARGFSSVNSEKLLVLIDTRSLYTPLFSGVFWDAQDYPLHDVERIEVIRGPGAALWGSNAVNGVINITSRSAHDTHGAYFEAGGGNEDRVIASARYGAALSESLSVRVFGRHAERDSTRNPTARSSDDWRFSSAGFRADWRASDADAFMFEGAGYRGDAGQFAPSASVIGRPQPLDNLRAQLRGGHVLGRWRRSFDDSSDVQVRVYFDQTHRDDPAFVDDLDTFDLDAQHRFALGRFLGVDEHEILWGVNYRHTQNDNDGKGVFALDPTSSADAVVSAFAQDQFRVGPAQVTLGSKFEHNDFSGFELQPSIRASWEATPAATFWSSISRAVRVPTRLERDIAVDATNPLGNPVLRLVGNRDFDSEKLLAYEVGLRWRLNEQVLLDLAAFHNRYKGLASLELGAPFIASSGRTIVPIVNRNLSDGDAQGFEAQVTYAPSNRWRIEGGYSYLNMDIEPQGLDLNRGRFREGSTPRHIFGVRSAFDVTERLQFDLLYRRLSDIRSLPEIVSGAGIQGYSELDVRIAYRMTDRLELSVVGQSLLHDEHIEFGGPASRGAIERSVYGKATWGF